MEVHERELPGVGHKFTIRPEAGGQVVVVIHHSGKRELLYFSDDDEAEPSLVLMLTDPEARELGAILAGVMFQPETVGDAATRLAGQSIEWHQLTVGSDWVGRTVANLQQTDVHILAILRDDDALIPNPAPEVRLEAGDTVVVAGRRDAVVRFRARITAESP